MAAPSYHEAEVVAAGFRIRTHRAQLLREIEQVSVEIRRGAPPAAAWGRRRNVFKSPARYRILTSEGGSGGLEYVLQVWRPCPGGHVWLEQRMQSEFGEPGFELGWQVFESVSTR